MVNGGDIIWADLGDDFGRRPYCVLTRQRAIDVLNALVCAAVTGTIRGLPTEVQLDKSQMPKPCVVNCDQIVRVPKGCISKGAAASLTPEQMIDLNEAVKFALGLV